MPKDALFRAAGLPDPQRCCAALGNNHRCSKPVSANGNGIICDDHAMQIYNVLPVRMYKQSTYRNTALGAEFAKLSTALDEKAKKPEPSWFARILTPQGIGTIVFVLAVYLLELIELRALSIPKSVALNSFDSVAFALGNILPVLAFTVIAFGLCAFVIALGVLLGICAMRLWQVVWGYGGLFSARVIEEAIIGARYRLRLPMWVKLIRLSDQDKAEARSNYGSKMSQSVKEMKARKAQVASEFESVLNALPGDQKTARKLFWTRLRKCWAWYYDRIYVRDSKRVAVNFIQLFTIGAIFLGTLYVANIVAKESGQRLVEKECRVNLATDLAGNSKSFANPFSGENFAVPALLHGMVTPFLTSATDEDPHVFNMFGYEFPKPRLAHAVSTIVFPVDGGFLVLDNRRLRAPTRLALMAAPPHSITPDSAHTLHSERVIYLGDYGDWAVVVPIAKPKERVMIRRTHIVEFSLRAPNRGAYPVEPEPPAPVTASRQALQSQELGPALLQKRRTASELLVLAEILAVALPRKTQNNGPRASYVAQLQERIERLHSQFDEFKETRGEMASRAEVRALLASRVRRTELHALTRLAFRTANERTQALRDSFVSLSDQLSAINTILTEQKNSVDADLAAQQQALAQADQRNLDIALKPISGIKDDLSLLNARLHTNEDAVLVAQAQAAAIFTALTEIQPNLQRPFPLTQIKALQISLAKLSDTMTSAAASFNAIDGAAIAARRPGLLGTRRAATFQACMANRPSISEFVYFENGKASGVAGQVERALVSIENALDIDKRLIGRKTSKAYVFFGGSASASGSQEFNNRLSEQRADWVERVWSRSLQLRKLQGRALHDVGIETIAFGEGENLPLVIAGKRHSPRAVEVFICQNSF